MIRTPLPEWFPADHVFARGDAWYVGNPTGLRLGPYPDRTTAESCSVQVATMLTGRRSAGAQLALLRELMREPICSENAAPTAMPAPTVTPAPAVSSAASDVRTTAAAPVPAPEPLRVRAGEPARTWFRSSQVFRENECYFIATREGIEVGPYPSESAARAAAQRLIELLGEARESGEACALIRAFNEAPAPDEPLESLAPSCS